MTEGYAELHAHSGFSFLDGSSDPEELVAEADRLGLDALALTDHHGFYGVVRFAEAARVCGLPTVFGTEVTLAPAGARTGEPDPTGTHLLVLARDPTGYARLSTVLADARRGGPLAGVERLPEGGGPCRADGGRAAGGLQGGGAAGRGVRARQRRAGAVGPRGPARHGAQRRAGPSRRRVGRRRRGDQQRALRHPGRLPAGHPARRRAGAPAPGST